MAVRVEDVYEEYIRDMSPAEKLELIELIKRKLADVGPFKGRSRRTGDRREITELHGLGGWLWQGVDTEDYINDLRNEWNTQQ